ncbi:MAG TPA: prepilin-type N-terminal cleavage/methylation domain-containing protein [Firmicutes bacterium]|jgi:prepilin-type N-terminal cleavage/methylation domain-containing protein|nr:prepilin-type N-terminal cleavage/methylation domain-containing protein [Bacillota bacterium]
MKIGKQGSHKNLLTRIGNEGFTLVEVLIVIMVIPLILGVSFGVMSAALSMYRTIDARSGLSSAGTHMLEVIGQDIRGLTRLYDTSSETRLNGYIYKHAADVDYQFIPPDSDSPGALTRNGKDITSSRVSVASCKFDYLKPAQGSDAPKPPEPSESSAYESVLPSLASCVRVRVTLELGTSSMTFESIFHMRNL